MIHSVGTPRKEGIRAFVEELSTRTIARPTPGATSGTPTKGVKSEVKPKTPNDQPVATAAQEQIPQRQAAVPDAKAEAPIHEVDPNWSSFTFLSEGIFYPKDVQVSIQPLKGTTLAKFSRARKEAKLRYTVEGIASTLQGISAFDLTPADFYFVMYWQRVNSLPKTPMLITGYCTDEKHNYAVHVGTPDAEDPENPDKVVKLDESTLRTERVLQATTLETQYLVAPDFSDLAVAAKYQLDVERMIDVVELSEYLVEKDATEEFSYAAAYAAFLSPFREDGTRMSLVDRVPIVEQMSAEDITELDEYIRRVTSYGVSEYATINCKECGAPIRVKLSIDALSFFPGLR